MKARTNLSRCLRRDQTDAERRMWAMLRNRQLDGFKFRRQLPIERYVADFVCEEAMLVVELDGGQHASQEEYDAGRTAVLEAAGYRVVRFWNNAVIEGAEGVLDAILAELRSGRG